MKAKIEQCFLFLWGNCQVTNRLNKLNYIPWTDRLQAFRKTLDHAVFQLKFQTSHEYNAIAKILETRALYLRYEADELLSEKAEVQTKD